jgi:hypothetical protein
VRFVRQEGPAAGGQDARRAAQEAADHLGLAGAEEGLAVAFEDLGDGAVGGADDFLVGILEGDAQLPGQRGADRGLARPHHAHQNDRLHQTHWRTIPPGPRARTCRREIFPPQWREVFPNAI